MNSQRRRLNAESRSNSTLNDQTADNIDIVMDEQSMVNAHGLRYCGSIEPENADANANGFWICLCLPADVIPDNSSNLPNDFGSLDNEDFMPYVWGVGCWTASNQAPYHFEFVPSTSRNCQKGARILAYIVKTGISAGQVRINQTLTCFTT